MLTIKKVNWETLQTIRQDFYIKKEKEEGKKKNEKKRKEKMPILYKVLLIYTDVQKV